MWRRIAAVAAAVAAVGLWPSVALGNGGAYIEFDGTHHLPGEQVTGEVYVSLSAKQRDLLDRGPFYAYLLPGNASIREGSPVPADAIRVGTFAVTEDGNDTELGVTFTVPEVVGDYYQVGLCNDPCTVAGFGEPVSGSVSIVATAREASLLTDNGRLHTQVSRLKRDVRRAEKAAEDQATVASADFDESEASRLSLAGRVQALEAELADVLAAAEEAAGRPLIDPWAAAAVAVALLALAAVATGRRRSAPTDGALAEGA